jgi:hypothetical protein
MFSISWAIGALSLSIITPPTELTQRPGLRALMQSGLIYGLLVAAYFTYQFFAAEGRQVYPPYGILYLYFGPALVALWNLVRMRLTPKQT